ncbi:Xanthine dehydrogenase, FAD binding subunit [hydrothermal vent metagenome]|uniref:Xanthine dehydrogenase, FAD binding subunit n=1 Tax=hydrothermal vent metagenome TaxID=652676 RepID=A0A3B1DDD8_9ZZZZ
MHDFEYEAPDTLEKALKVLSQNNGSAKLLAGGTDIIDQIRNGRHAPDLLIDLKKIPELNELKCDSNGLHIGAAVPCYQIYGHDDILTHYTALADSCKIIGGIQVQSRASVGGNLCNSGPAADSIPSLIALNAICHIAGKNGTREVAVENFCTAPSENVLEPDELLVALALPAWQPHSGSHYRRFIPRNEMDIAVVGVGASVLLDDANETILSARIALGAVAATPLFAEEASNLLAGQPVTDDIITQAAEACRAIATPIDDHRGTAEFRLHLVGVLVERVLKQAIEQAK